MKATLTSVRIAPKKAQLVAKMIRGLSAQAALVSLQHTNKKAARILETLLQSAIANARTNERQSIEALIIESIIVNKAQALDRGVPMARGRIRPMRKFMSHIDIVLGIDGMPSAPKKSTAKSAKNNKSLDSASQATEKPVKSVSTKATKQTTKSTKGSSSLKKDTTASRSTSVRSKSTTKK